MYRSFNLLSGVSVL